MVSVPDTVLYVDDNADSVEPLTHFLKMAGYAIVYYSSALKVVEDLEKNCLDYQLALVDLRMPEMDGADLVAILKKHKPNTPVFVYSGYKSKVKDADELLLKPVYPDVLVGLIKKYLK